MLTEREIVFVQRCLVLAEEALLAGDEPFGSVLVSAEGKILAEDRNRIAAGDSTRHPEFELARWAANNLTPAQRASATVYTSGEHCPMCAAAHGWVGLGRIVYISSAEQLGKWRKELGAPAAPVAMLPIQQVVPGIEVVGPLSPWDQEVKSLHIRRHPGS